MSRSSEVLFFSTDIGCLGECFKLPFLSFPGRGCCLLSPTAQHIKKLGGFFPAGPYRASSFTKVYFYTLSIGSFIVDGPRAIPILSSHVLGIS